MILVSNTEALEGTLLSILNGVVFKFTKSAKCFGIPLDSPLLLENQVDAVARSEFF